MTVDIGSPPQRDATPVGIVRPIAVGRRARGRWSGGRRLVLGLVAAIVLIGGYYAVSLYQVWSTGRDDGARPVDAIVVMGAAQYDGDPSPVLAARLDHAVDLWEQGVADRVVVTGGKQPADRFTEAEASAAYLAERGVPADAILLEGESRSTFEALEAVEGLLAAQGLEEVLIVTDPYHSLRSRIIAEDAGLEAWTSPTPFSVVDGGESFERHLQEAAGVAIGRIIGFDDL